MGDSPEKRLEKLEAEIAVLRQDYMHICGLVGNQIGFMKNLRGAVEFTDAMSAKILESWTTEVDKRDSVSDLFRDLRDRFKGGE